MERAVAAMSSHPEHQLNRIMSQAERLFYTFCPQEFSRDLTRIVTSTLLEAIDPRQIDSYTLDLAGFAELNRKKLEVIFNRWGPNTPAADNGSFILAGQPESIVIFERISNGPIALDDVWSEADLPEEWLSDLKGMWI